jgi:hypothetical protein
MDTRGRFFVANKHAYAVALSKHTGQVLRVVQAAKEELDLDIDLDLKGRFHLELDEFIWVGRVDYEITVHDARTGEVDVKFSTSEVLGVEDMLEGSLAMTAMRTQEGRTTGNGSSSSSSSNTGGGVHPPSPLRNNENMAVGGGMMIMGGMNQMLTLPASKNEDGGGTALTDVFPKNQRPLPPRPSQPADLNPPPISSELEFESNIVSTPGGRLAMRDPESGDIQWISDDTFESPIAYAVESSTGASLGVHFVPDAPMAHLFSEEYVEGEIERQLDESHDRDRMQNHGSQHDETVFGSLGNGELFALPLGRRSFRNGHGNGRNGLSHVPRLSSTAGTSAKHLPAKIPPITANGDWQHGFEKEHAAIAAGNSNSNSNTNNAGVGTALTRVVAPASNTCDQNSKNFARCLAEMYGDAMEKLMIEQQQQIEKLSTSSIHHSPNTFYQKEHNDGSAKDQ